ncbi:hypothetical protein J1605_002707 [Eschrichtius robustus]|uniref:Uncharacterized protein n=1 Tax=Eschrichtius robustus TaxID=9764 RepID=A0AB34HY83_ESCRO|nr:hypothetical protein J1605_002707 [Eschrichtius robustus]
MAAAVGVRGRWELPPCSSPGWFLSLSALLSVAARGAFATTHWVVTEDGKIQQQVAARVSLSARARPRPGGDSPARPGPWLFGSARPRPQPAFPRSRCRGVGDLSPRTRPLPTCVLDLASAACKFSGFHPWGRATLPGSSCPGDIIWLSSFKTRIHYPSSGASLAHASPVLPEEVESRWQRPGVRESQGGDSFGTPRQCVI